MDNLDVCYLSLEEQVEAIKTKELSPVEMMEAVLSRIEKINPKINAYCTIVADSAKEQAKQAESMVMKGEKQGPLHGVPISIKDLTFTKGIRTTFGSRIFKNFIPEQDSVVVERLKAAGAIIVGKTNTPEFGFKAVTDNALFGVTRNPWNTEHTSGGSSGGAAAAVASGMGSLAMGSDAGGSIRIPSSFCGVFGIKPSFGRVPQYPTFGAGGTFACTGPITRTVRDAALTLEIIAGKDERDRFSLPGTKLSYLPFIGGDLKGLKIAWSQDLGYATVDSQVLKSTGEAAKIFETVGATVEAVDLKLESPSEIYATMKGMSFVSLLQDKMEEWGGKIDPHLALLIQQHKSRPAADFLKASRQREEFWHQLRPLFDKYDLLLTPTMAIPPVKLDDITPDLIAGIKGSTFNWMSFNYPFNLTGQPAASVPCGRTDDGLPVGLEIIGRRFDEVTVLRSANAFEQASPWVEKRPPLD